MKKNIISLLKNKTKPITVFEKFWSGNHSQLINHYNANPDEQYSDEEVHYIFASFAITGVDTEPINHKIPGPLSIADFNQQVIEKYRQELASPQLGVLNQPRFIQKSLFAAAVGLANKKINFVETGTYIGASTYKISSLFQNLSTIEASPELYEAARQLLCRCDNINCHLGNSSELLKQLSTAYLNNSVVFLDAHYSTGLTSKLYGACPVIDEIRILLDKSPSAIVVVDDIRTMNGKNGYPTLSQIFSKLPSNIKFDFIFDQMIFTGSGIVEYPQFMKS